MSELRNAIQAINEITQGNDSIQRATVLWLRDEAVKAADELDQLRAKTLKPPRDK